MITVTAKTDGAFGKRMEERMRKWAGISKFAGCIRVSEKLGWWRFQEYGTAPYTLKADPLGLLPGMAAIWRRYADALSFEHHGQQYIAVNIKSFPGIPPRHMVQSAKEDIHVTTHSRIHNAMAHGAVDNPTVLHKAVLESTSDAKRLIAESFARKLSRIGREDGKLEGQTAAEAFFADAMIVDTSE